MLFEKSFHEIGQPVNGDAGKHCDGDISRLQILQFRKTGLEASLIVADRVCQREQLLAAASEIDFALIAKEKGNIQFLF